MYEKEAKLNKQESVFTVMTSGILAIAVIMAYFNARDQRQISGSEICTGMPGSGSLMYSVDQCTPAQINTGDGK